MKKERKVYIVIKLADIDRIYRDRVSSLSAD